MLESFSGQVRANAYHLRKLTNEVFLWLPADLATELSQRLLGGAGDPGYHEFMNKIRKHLQGADDTLESFRFITFPY